ncbi:PREDICTED: bone morphogenetic protein 2-like [Priapulus caudatus]|uniref:Bone morphogenetic protein 2-like n=1 Tax=Priapulus caudatus TaxID=37621 RepID=A0ABM1E6X8_PRICU|nr:PREDICTED: bone morphogenetic protein 2-like [Priapulus caudatus]
MAKHRLLAVGALLVFTCGVALARPTIENESIIKAQAVDKLMRIFGMQGKGRPVADDTRDAPQYMLDLYRTVVGDAGVMTTANPFDANVVRSFTAQGRADTLHYVFNTTSVVPAENVLGAELHLFKLKPKREYRQRIRPGDHIVEIRVFQVRTDSNRLLEARRTSLYSVGWEVFHVTEVVKEWQQDGQSNQGIVIEIVSLSGDVLPSTLLRFAKRREHNKARQPLLVVFTDDGRPRATKRVLANASNDIFHPNALMTSRDKRNSEPVDYAPLKSQHEADDSPCALRPLYVDFEKIGWSSWIISPKGYHAYHCKGQCPFPLGETGNPTNHATVQSIVSALGLHDGVSAPCCVPDKLHPIGLLYFDEDENVVLKQYEDMVASSCGCH